MDPVRFVFWEAVKALSLVILCLLAAKAVAGLRMQGRPAKAGGVGLIRGILYAVILGLALLGAEGLGIEVAAGVHDWASEDHLANLRIARAYDHALRAVQLRPGVLGYWQTLARAKLAERQCSSLLKDRPVFESLSGGDLDEAEVMRFAYCHYYLGQYDKVIFWTQGLIRRNRVFAAPYVLQGMAYTSRQDFSEAERTYLQVLQMFPTHEAAVEGLAHAYFLEGNKVRARAVLEETTGLPFPPEARKRFEALMAFYAQ